MKYLLPLMLAVWCSFCSSVHAEDLEQLTPGQRDYPEGGPFDVQAKFDEIETLFASDSTVLSNAAKATLKPFINRVKYSSSTMLTVAGHSDARGSKNRNLVLSMTRAKVVRDFLIDHGVRPEKISLVAHGESRAAVNIQQSDKLVEDRRVVVTAIRHRKPVTVADTATYGAIGQMP